MNALCDTNAVRQYGSPRTSGSERASARRIARQSGLRSGPGFDAIRLDIEADSTGHCPWFSAVRIHGIVDEQLSVAHDSHMSDSLQDRSFAAVPRYIFRMARYRQPAILAQLRSHRFIPNFKGLIYEGSHGIVGP